MKLKVCDTFRDLANGRQRPALECLDLYHDKFAERDFVLTDSKRDELRRALTILVITCVSRKRWSEFDESLCGRMHASGIDLDHLHFILGESVQPFVFEHYQLTTNWFFDSFEGNISRENAIEKYEQHYLRFFIATREVFRDCTKPRKHGRFDALGAMYRIVQSFAYFLYDFKYKDDKSTMRYFFEMCLCQLDEMQDDRTGRVDAEALYELLDLICGVVGSRNRGCSVTKRIKNVKQPRGGYLNPRKMDAVSIGDGIEALNPAECTSANIVGMAVDYLTRFMSGTPVREAFLISMLGAAKFSAMETANALIEKIIGLDDTSIINAAHLVTFDAVYRAGIPWVDIDDIDTPTIENIRTMVNRALAFFDKYGSRVLDGFTMEGGYTSTVSTGDGDFLTSDTLWDFKVSKNPPTKDHTLQLLMYWRMGLHSVHPEFKSVRYLGIYNPRLNTVYRISVDDISDDVIHDVEHAVIGYE